MKVIKFLPAILGGLGVLQSTLNKTIAGSHGLSTAAMINGIVVAICGVLLFVVSYNFPALFADIIPFNSQKGFSFRWWYLLPGMIGITLVFVTPLIMIEVGALPVFLGFIAGQIIVSIAWDAYFENIPLNSIRIFGALLTFVGAMLVIWKK